MTESREAFGLQILKLLAKELERPVTSAELDLPMVDVVPDSFERVNVMFALRDDLGIQLDPAHLADIRTLNELITYMWSQRS
jgi:acyl carrier protein